MDRTWVQGGTVTTRMMGKEGMQAPTQVTMAAEEVVMWEATTEVEAKVSAKAGVTRVGKVKTVPIQEVRRVHRTVSLLPSPSPALEGYRHRNLTSVSQNPLGRSNFAPIERRLASSEARGDP